MFGLIASGRMVQTDFLRLPDDPTKFIVDIPQADNIKHVVLFMTGAESFPPGYGGQIYFSWPDSQNQASWQLLGYISNDKPSAIFKIAHLKKIDANATPVINSMFFGQSTSHHAQIGISVETMDTIFQATPAANTEPVTVSSYVEFAQKMLDDFVNYAGSFGQADLFKMDTLRSWYERFQRRLQADPNFWR